MTTESDDSVRIFVDAVIPADEISIIAVNGVIQSVAIPVSRVRGIRPDLIGLDDSLESTESRIEIDVLEGTIVDDPCIDDPVRAAERRDKLLQWYEQSRPRVVPLRESKPGAALTSQALPPITWESLHQGEWLDLEPESPDEMTLFERVDYEDQLRRHQRFEANKAREHGRKKPE